MDELVVFAGTLVILYGLSLGTVTVVVVVGVKNMMGRIVIIEISGNTSA